MVPYKEVAVQRHVSDISTLPSGSLYVFPLKGLRHPSLLSEYEVFVFRDVEATVFATADIGCNSGLDIGDMIGNN